MYDIKHLKAVIKNIKFVVTISLVLIITSCGGDDNEVDVPIPSNEPPNSFSLLTVTNEVENVDLKPMLTWSTATDPDGDTVTYELILDNNTSPSTVIASNLTETEFTFSSKLQFLEVFYWKVIAKDTEGNSTESDIFSFTTVDLFSQATANAQFSSKIDHETVVFNDKIWVIGGSDGNADLTNDIWSSSDGINWTEATANASFSRRASHASVIFDDKMWIIGGYAFAGKMNDVWSSSDGINWSEMTPNANFSPRYAHTSVVFDNKIWVIGGEVGSLDVLNDIWNSTDGINWTKVDAIGAPDKGRHSAIVFDNKIWLIAGLGQSGSTNDIWNSSDGINWTQITSDASFAKRYYHTTAVIDGKLWVIGGIGLNNDLYNDVWNTSDGVNWTEVTSDAPFSKRSLHTSITFKDKLWVIAGLEAGARKNDVWSMN